jgi:tRNA-specific 2-thiouridylase
MQGFFITAFFPKKGRFRPKDQSYFLYSLSQKQFSRTHFPLGESKKQHVRDMAISYGLHTSKKAESRYFIGDSNYSCLFMENESRNGYIVDSK